MAELNSFDFRLRTRIVFGPGRLAELGEIARGFGGKAMLVLYENPAGLEKQIEAAEESLSKASIDVIRFDEVQPDPSSATAEEGARLARRHGIELVIGMGGGSVLDAAKGISLLARSPGGIWNYLMCNPSRLEPKEALPKILIPTTSGTGSEVSFAAVFSDPSRDLKATVVSPLNAPEVALIDPALTLAMPPQLTAACGADALGHCLECYISRAQTPPGRLFSGEGVRLTARHLRKAVNDGSDIAARSGMALAAMYGGLGLAYSSAIGTHALAHAMGALLHVPHGLCIGLMEPHILEHNLTACALDYASLAPLFGIERRGRNDEAVARNLITGVADLLRSIGIPERIKVRREQTTKAFARAVAENAKYSTPKSVDNTPVLLSIEDMKDIYLKVVES